MTGWAIGIAVLALVAVLTALAVLAVRARRGAGDVGRPTGGDPERAVPRDLAAPADGLVLLQLSAAYCRSCRDARGVLAEVARELPRVTHREIDLATRPELSARLDVAATPTTLLVDAAGTELLRVRGVPRRRELVLAVEAHLRRDDARG